MNHLWPLITHSSPSGTAVVPITVGSEPALNGSVSAKALEISPRRLGHSHRSFCASVAPCASSSMLPLSGAWTPKMVMENMQRPMISDMSANLSWPKSTAPQLRVEESPPQPALFDPALEVCLHRPPLFGRQLAENGFERDQLVVDEGPHPPQLLLEFRFCLEVPGHSALSFHRLHVIGAWWTLHRNPDVISSCHLVGSAPEERRPTISGSRRHPGVDGTPRGFSSLTTLEFGPSPVDVDRRMDRTVVRARTSSAQLTVVCCGRQLDRGRGDDMTGQTDKPLAGMSALITGGGGGIGGASAAWLARDGAAVMIMGRTEATLVKARDDIVAAAGAAATVEYTVGDALDEQALRARLLGHRRVGGPPRHRRLGGRRRHHEAALDVRRGRGARGDAAQHRVCVSRHPSCHPPHDEGWRGIHRVHLL